MEKTAKCFQLSVMLPRQDIPCNTATLQEVGLNESCTLACHYKDGDVLKMLAEVGTSIIWNAKLATNDVTL